MEAHSTVPTGLMAYLVICDNMLAQLSVSYTFIVSPISKLTV